MKFLLAFAVGFMTVTLFSARLNAADSHLKDLFNLREITTKPSASDSKLPLTDKRGDWPGAIQELTVHIENRQTDADDRRLAYLERGYAHFRNGDKESGLADLKTAILLVQTREHWVEVALVFAWYAVEDEDGLRQSGLIADGIAICTEGLDAKIAGEPDKTALAYLHRIRGVLHIVDENYKQAIDDFRCGHELVPGSVPGGEHYRDRPEILPLVACINVASFDDERVELLAAYLIDNPKNSEAARSYAYMVRAFIQSKGGNVDQAIEELNRSIELKPTAPAFEGRWQLHYHKGELQKAIDDLTELLKYVDDFSEELRPEVLVNTYNSRGYLYSEMGNTDAALNDYTNAIIQDPYNISARHQRADILSQKGDWHGAIADYDNMLQTYPEQEAGPLLYLRGVAYRRINECEKAWSDFNEAVRLESDEWHGRNNRVKSGYIICFHSAPPPALRQEIIDTIIADTTALLEADDAPMDKMEAQMDAHLFRGVFYWHDEQYDEALADFDAIIKEKGDGAPMTRLRRALVQLRLAEKEDGRERLERALADAEAVIQTDAKCGEAYFCRAKVLEAMDESDKAKADIDQAKQLGFDGNESALFVFEYKITEN